jgi:hypothetical protein
MSDTLDGYIAGYVDGEGCFSIAVQRNPTCRIGFQLLPEFHVSQNGERREVLELIQQRLGCGYMKPNSKRDRALVYVVRERRALLDSVTPFFEQVSLISSKRLDFEKFAQVVWEMERGRHLTAQGFIDLLDLALSMNGDGRFRQVRWNEIVGALRLSLDAVGDQPVVPERVDDATLT